MPDAVIRLVYTLSAGPAEPVSVRETTMLRCTGFGRDRRLRRIRVEILESRALMSPLTAPAPVEVVRLLELDSPDTEPGNETESISVSEVPRAVLASFVSRFPQGVLLEAAADTTEDSLEYELRTEIQGTTFTVSLLADGTLVEVQRSMTIAELPTRLSAWLSDHFPDTTIQSAVQVTEQGLATFEVVLGVAGQSSLELTLQLADVDPNLGPGGFSAVGGKPTSGGIVPKAVDTESGLPAPNPAVAENGVTQGHSSTPEWPVSGLTSSAPMIRPDDRPGDIEDDRAVSHPAWGTRLVVNMTGQTAADSSGSTGRDLSSERLPAAEVLSDAPFADFSAIEQAMEQFLNGFERLADAVGGTSARDWWPNFAAIAALVGIERLTRNRRRAESDAVFAAGSSWQWILRLSTLK